MVLLHLPVILHICDIHRGDNTPVLYRDVPISSLVVFHEGLLYLWEVVGMRISWVGTQWI